MTKTTSDIRFEKARKRLSTALKDLEEVMKEKLHESAFQNKMISASEDDIERREAVLVEQATTIQTLHHEINTLQKNLEHVGKEVEFLNSKNEALAQRMNNLKSQGSSLIEAIELDLVQVQQLIKDDEESE